MKLAVMMLVAMAVFIFGAIGGWFVSRHYADESCGLALLAQIESDSSQQIARYEKIREILATGDNERLSKYLENQIEMATVALKSSVAAAKK